MPSPRPKWMRTTNGWRWGRYQIERLAPRMWVLTQLGNDPQSTPTIVTTAASLRALKHMAEWREARYTRRRVMWMHGLVALVAAVGLGAVTFLPSPAEIVSTLALLFVMLRSVAIVVVAATNGAWAQVRHTYQ
jgi:hypothetical protein